MSDETLRDQLERPLTRRQVLHSAVVSGVAVSASGFLAACGGSSGSGASTATGSAAPTGSIKAGGILRVGATGGGAKDSIDAHIATADTDIMRLWNLYEPLAVRPPDFGPLQMLVAESLEPEKGSAKTWIVKLRPGVEFHNGKTVTADDVIFSINRILDPKSPKTGATSIGYVDAARMKKLDKLTVRIPLKFANATFPDDIGQYFNSIVPVGYDPKKPVGTGAFKFQSFTPGQQSVFVKNPHYWQTGKPHVDQLVIIDFPDNTARVNALLGGQVDAIDTIRHLLGVESVHAIGYCVAGTTLAATLALLDARGDAGKVASATFFTAQVDFSDAGDLNLFVADETLQLVEQLAADKGYLDGRYMAATFNLLRGRDLIWNYVANNYLLGQDYTPFDLLHWNSDTTNLPLKWHLAYLKDFYRDNKLVLAGGLIVDGTPIDIHRVRTPTYVQAGREDHIAPARSVWKITHYFQGPLRFVLAGSGHIAGVVNPPEAQKYQYWTNDGKAATLEEFIAGATETKGSWWPDWAAWIEAQTPARITAKGARIPGKGKLKALEDAPGSYVKAR